MKENNNPLLYDETDGIAFIRMNRPDMKNAINSDVSSRSSLQPWICRKPKPCHWKLNRLPTIFLAASVSRESAPFWKKGRRNGRLS